MTRLEDRLAETLLRQVQGLTARQAVLRLLDGGLIDLKSCERMAIREEVFRLQQQGIPRCEAFEIAADRFCCSYEKARNAFYNPSKL
jgi:hypothetical protein